MNDANFVTWMSRILAILLLTVVSALCVALVVWAWDRVL